MMWKICIPVPLLLLLLPAVGEGSSSSLSASPGRINVVSSNLSTVVSSGQIIFGQHYNFRNWGSARSYCRWKGTDLATIGKDDVYDFSNGYGWIGVYRQDSQSVWKWSKGDQEVGFNNWATGEPVRGENCGHKIKGEVQWRSDLCNKTKTYMCQEETLVLVKELKTWEEALEHCRALEAVDPSKPATAYENHRYDLFTADYYSEAWAVMRHQDSTDEVWMGLRYLAGQWFWVGGRKVWYKDLDTCPSVRHCGVLLKKSRPLYGTRDCSLKMNFLCGRKR